MAKTTGQVISGSFDSIVVRQKSDAKLEIGQLLTAQTSQGKVLLQVFDLVYGSQLSQQNLEMISGMKLESDNDLELMDAELRNYTLAFLKPLLLLKHGTLRVCKTLPDFFSSVEELDASCNDFLEKPENPLFIGNLRTGSKAADAEVYLNGEDMFSHHVLIAAQTGRGKSNLMSCIIHSALQGEYAGFLILDPHDEYYGRNKAGLKDCSDKVVYYTPNTPPTGARTLAINISKIQPAHFNGVVFWSEPQKEALYAYYRKYGSKWITAILLEEDEILEGFFHEATILVVKRRLLQLLNLEISGSEIYSKGIFDIQSGISTVSDIADDMEKSKAVIIDTSSLSSQVEILVGSIVASELFNRYQNYKTTGELKDKPVLSVVLEEAPSVLGKDALEQGPNIFSRIAREGRKFRLGLTAITQLPSLMPRQVLANISTKIILGLETAPERKAVIESASQDLSQDDRAIASLDIGEAIVTSTFSKFAVPVKVPLYEDLLEKQPKTEYKTEFAGLH
ncbi:ATP-binding protein [Candidatus Woesearchaeota archaeon]|nr:ATP-binding protein [Candidatus Woesearchaeota archaeon]